MAWAVVVGAGISAGVAIYKGAKGASQARQARELAARQPGYQVNQGVIDNARTLSDNYGNYQLPGYGAIAGNINTDYSDAFSNGVRGASSGNDVLQLATNMAYGKNKAFNELGVENAQGKQGALAGYLQASAAAGEQYQNMNAYQRQQYEEQLRQRAALTQAGEENTYGAIDQLAAIGSKYAFSRAGTGTTKADDGSKTGNKTGLAQGFGTSNAFFPDGTPRFDDNGNPLPSAGHI